MREQCVTRPSPLLRRGLGTRLGSFHGEIKRLRSQNRPQSTFDSTVEPHMCKKRSYHEIHFSRSSNNSEIGPIFLDRGRLLYFCLVCSRAYSFIVQTRSLRYTYRSFTDLRSPINEEGPHPRNRIRTTLKSKLIFWSSPSRNLETIV